MVGDRLLLTTQIGTVSLSSTVAPAGTTADRGTATHFSPFVPISGRVWAADRRTSPELPKRRTRRERVRV